MERKMFKKDLQSIFYIIKDGEVLGRCLGSVNAQKNALIHEAAYCCIYEDLIQIEDEWLYKLYQDYVGELPPPPMVVEELARKAFTSIEATHHKTLRRPAAKDVIRAMYKARTVYTKEEIEMMCPGVKWRSLRVMIGQLKKDGLYIKHTGDGIYVRQ